MANFTKKDIPSTRIAIPILLARFSPINFSQSVFFFSGGSVVKTGGALVSVVTVTGGSCIGIVSFFSVAGTGVSSKLDFCFSTNGPGICSLCITGGCTGADALGMGVIRSCLISGSASGGTSCFF
jgi:hypothetical protein